MHLPVDEFGLLIDIKYMEIRVKIHYCKIRADIFFNYLIILQIFSAVPSPDMNEIAIGVANENIVSVLMAEAFYHPMTIII